jgi:hypothetical protein
MRGGKGVTRLERQFVVPAATRWRMPLRSWRVAVNGLSDGHLACVVLNRAQREAEAIDRNFGELGARQIEIANSLTVVPLARCAKSYTRHRCSEREDQ